MKPKLYLLLAMVIFLAACAAPAPTPAPVVDPAGSTMPALTDPAQPISVKAGDSAACPQTVNTAWICHHFGPLATSHMPPTPSHMRQ